MQHPVVPSSYPSIKLEAYPAAVPPGIAFDYNYNYHHNHHPHHHLGSLPPPAFTPDTLSNPASNMAKRALSDSDCEDLFSDNKDR
jgi:hypothetical protein